MGSRRMKEAVSRAEKVEAEACPWAKTTGSRESPAEGRAKGNNSILASFFLVQWYPERVPEGPLQFLL